MRFEPDHEGWSAFIKFELRYSEIELARRIYERYTQVGHLFGWIVFFVAYDTLPQAKFAKIAVICCQSQMVGPFLPVDFAKCEGMGALCKI